MNGNVVEMISKVDPVKPKLILGLIPCQNQYILSMVAPVITPGLKELADLSMEEFTVYQMMNDILFGAKQLHIAYADYTGTSTPENSQERFAARLQDPAKDYVGFTIIEPLRNAGFHIYAAYIKPEFRDTDFLRLGLACLEKEAVSMGAPYISLATRHDVSGALARLGFVETTSYYRKKLKE